MLLMVVERKGVQGAANFVDMVLCESKRFMLRDSDWLDLSRHICSCHLFICGLGISIYGTSSGIQKHAIKSIASLLRFEDT